MKKNKILANLTAAQVSGLTSRNINSTLFWAYRHSTEVGNDFINFDDVIWDYEIEDIAKTLRENGISEFTISSGFSGLIETLAAFEKQGFKMAGLTQIKAKCKSGWHDDENELIPAVRMVG